MKAGKNVAFKSSFINKATYVWDTLLQSEVCYLEKNAFTLEKAEVSFEETGKSGFYAHLTEQNDLPDFQSLLFEIYSSFEDDVLSALVVILHEFTEKKQNDIFVINFRQRNRKKRRICSQNSS